LPQQVGPEFGPVEAHREWVAHIGYEGEVEKFRGVELITQPTGIRSVVLVEYVRV
jgi:hypothetical protein